MSLSVIIFSVILGMSCSNEAGPLYFGCCLDYEFIISLEGFTTHGEVPSSHGKPLGHSGVTIGSGVDLGTKNLQFLESLDLGQDLINKLRPYLGLQGMAAVQKLRQQPLILTESQAKLLSQRVMSEQTREVASMYNRASRGSKWCGLNVSERTVIASVLYQYGSPSRVPSFWGYVTSQDWKKTIAELRNFHDKYPTRRRKEADYLEKGSGKCTN